MRWKASLPVSGNVQVNNMIFHTTCGISPYSLETKTQRIYSLLRDDVKDNQPTHFNIPQERIREKKLGTGLYTPDKPYLQPSLLF